MAWAGLGLFVSACAGDASAGGGGGAVAVGAATGGSGIGGAHGTGGAHGAGGVTVGSAGAGTGGGSATGGTGAPVTSTGGRSASGGAAGMGTGAASTGGHGTGGTGSGSGGTAAGAGTGGVSSNGTGGTTAAYTCPPGPFAALAVAGLVPSRIASVPPSDSFNNNRKNFDVIEGPVWAGSALYVSEIAAPDHINPPLSRILKVTPAGAVSIALDNTGSNGMAIDAGGNLVAGNHKDGAITRFTLPALTATSVVSSFNGVRFDSPNDLVLRADGNLYFTDPDWQASITRPQIKTRIYRLAPGSNVATAIDESRMEPNGIVLTPDGNTMYVTGADGLFRYAVAANGTIGAGTKVAPSIVTGDGMAIDCAGNLFVAANDANMIVVLDSSGNTVGTIAVPDVMAVTNAAFGGTDHKTLYISALGMGAQSGLFTVGMTIPGLPY